MKDNPTTTTPGALVEVKDTATTTDTRALALSPITSLSAAATDVDEKNLWQSLRKWPRVLGYSLGLASAILLYGFDTSIVGNVAAVPQFQHDYGRKLGKRYIIPSMWLGLWNAMGPIGIMAGSIFAGWFQDRVGRRASLALGSCVSAGGVGMLYASHVLANIDARRGLFLAAKLVLGLALGSILCTTQTSMSEILPPRLRASILAFFPTFILLGQLIGAVVVYASLDFPGRRSYTTPILAQWAFSAIPLVWAVVLPESPTWLVRKGRLHRAVRAQQRLDSRRVSTPANIEAIQYSLKIETERARQDCSSYRECARGINRRRTLIVIFAMVIPQLFGLSILGDASYFIQVVGMNASNALLFLQLGIALGLVANLVSMWVLTRVDRRRLIVPSLAVTALLWLGMGVAGCFRGIVTIWYTAVTMIVIIVVVGVAAWPASYVVAAETSSLRLRAKTQGVGWFCGALAQGSFGISMPYAYNADQGNLRAKIGFIFVALCAVAALVTYLCVPEMKDRTAVEIDLMFELQVSAREFKRWRPRSVDPPRTSA